MECMIYILKYEVIFKILLLYMEEYSLDLIFY